MTLNIDNPLQNVNRGIAIIRKNCLFARSEVNGRFKEMPITKTKSPPSGGNSFDCYPAIINKERTLANLEQPSRSYELGRLARRPVMTECGLNGDVEDGTLRRLDFFQNVSNCI